MATITWEYFAGLFDGEGHVTISHLKKDDTYRLVLALTNTDKIALQYLQAQFGGKLHEKTRNGSLGKKKCYILMWHGKDAKEVARNLLPYSVIKSSQLMVIMRYPSLPSFNQYTKKEVFLELKQKQKELKNELVTIRESVRHS
jgi:hypothetical protein